MPKPLGRLPFMPAFADDWLTSPTRLKMNTSERAIYWDLILYQWRDGSLPADQETLAKMAQVSIQEFAQAAPAVLRNFNLRRGRYRNKKVALLYRSGLERKTNSQLSGHKGGSAKAKKDKEMREFAMTRASLSVSLSGSCDSRKAENQEKPSPRARENSAPAIANGNPPYNPGPGFAWFAGQGGQPAAYPSIRDMDAACRAWISVVESAETETLVRRALAEDGPWRMSQQWAKGVYDDGANWLLRKLWCGKPARRVETASERSGKTSERIAAWRPKETS